jgi:hypothetical protein
LVGKGLGAYFVMAKDPAPNLSYFKLPVNTENSIRALLNQSTQD